MKKKIIGSIGNIKIVTPSDCAKNTDLIYEDGIIKWGVCKHPYKIKESDKGRIGEYMGKPILAHCEELVKRGELSITEEGILLKRDNGELKNLVITGPANNEIWYTTSDENIIKFDSSFTDKYTILSNTYSDGIGLVVLSSNLTELPDGRIETGLGTIGLFGGNAFANTQSNITTITLPSSITTIGNLGFSLCGNLTSINYSGTISQWNAISKGNNWKSGLSSTTVIICTDGTVALD